MSEVPLYLARGAGRGQDGEDAQHRHHHQALVAPQQLRQMLPRHTGYEPPHKAHVQVMNT